MEKSNIEVQRFDQKAEGYTKALKVAPKARILEISSILNIVNDFVKKNDLTKRQVRVVELMAGSGYLTNFLFNEGYRKIHAIEPNNKMSLELGNSKDIEVHSVPDIGDIEPILKDIKPHIVIALAGFHHVIHYEQDEVINYDKSYAKQYSTVEVCMKHMAETHLMLIADIFEDDLISETQFESPYWNTTSTKKHVDSDIISREVREKLIQTKDISEYSKIAEEHFQSTLGESNSSLKWFRQVVDKYSSPGHKDTAISASLLNNLKREYETRFSILKCPWIFKNEKQFQEYVTAFWFLDEKNDTKKLQDVFEQAEKINGTKENNDGTFFFGWELSIITIRKKEAPKASTFYRRLFILLISLISFLLVGIYLKTQTQFYDMTRFIEKTFLISYGIIIKELYDKVINSKWLTVAKNP